MVGGDEQPQARGVLGNGGADDRLDVDSAPEERAGQEQAFDGVADDDGDDRSSASATRVEALLAREPEEEVRQAWSRVTRCGSLCRSVSAASAWPHGRRDADAVDEAGAVYLRYSMSSAEPAMYPPQLASDLESVPIHSSTPARSIWRVRRCRGRFCPSFPANAPRRRAACARVSS